MRNLELLTDVECMEISMKEYSPDHGALLQQKVKHTLVACSVIQLVAYY